MVASSVWTSRQSLSDGEDLRRPGRWPSIVWRARATFRPPLPTSLEAAQSLAAELNSEIPPDACVRQQKSAMTLDEK
jgi:hypothetical protein